MSRTLKSFGCFAGIVLAMLLRCTAAAHTAAPPIPRPANDSGMILYLAPDGHTLKRIRPDGTHAQTLLTLKKTSWYSVSPSGDSLLYDTEAGVALLRRGKPIALHLPRLAAVQWLPQSARLFGIINDAQHRYNGCVYVYDTRTLSGVILARMPTLDGITFAPDGRRFFGTISDPSHPQNGHVYVYDMQTQRGKVTAVQGRARWFQDGLRLLYVRSRPSLIVLKSALNNTTNTTEDFYQYRLSTDATTPLTNLEQAVITLPRGDRGTNAWHIWDFQLLPDGKTIAFSGWPRYMSGAGMNYISWYRIPASGLPLGNEPERLTGANLTFLAHRTRSLALVSGTYHGSACFNPRGLALIQLDEQKPQPIGIPLYQKVEPSSGDQAANLYGFDWSPRARQVVFSAASYICKQFSTDQETIIPATIYIWNVTLDQQVAKTQSARLLVAGTAPVWVGRGWLSR